ncbi:MAG: EFR1 family ferrodoxin [Bacteroidales bacterium]|nr:EFR1 family ferrodoxin [Bacteroidales bacterium]MCD8394362.1 EFR1 family ferrodoxin [Bacteroidales bacterium]
MIFTFTGTGNSLYVAQMLAKHLGERITLIRDELATEPGRRSINLRDERRVIWVFPIYSWGVPPVVKRFIRSVRFHAADGLGHHMVATCGDDSGLADKIWRRLISRRGWTPMGAYTVIMPNTYTLMKGFNVDPPKLARQKLEAAPKRVEAIAGYIKGGLMETQVTRGRWAWIKTKWIYPWFQRHAMSPKPFHTTDACVGCGECARACPLENIVMYKRRPTWRDDCALCLRCYHICPNHAVAYGRATASKGQYLCPFTPLSLFLEN